MKTKIAALVSVMLLAGACAPTVETRGNLVSDAKFKVVQPYVSSRAEVERVWGPPTATSAFDANTWYYIGETTAQSGVFKAKVRQRRMIRVRFGADDLVTEVAEIDPAKGREVDLVDRKTPTAG